MNNPLRHFIKKDKHSKDLNYTPIKQVTPSSPKGITNVVNVLKEIRTPKQIILREPQKKETPVYQRQMIVTQISPSKQNIIVPQRPISLDSSRTPYKTGSLMPAEIKSINGKQVEVVTGQGKNRQGFSTDSPLSFLSTKTDKYQNYNPTRPDLKGQQKAINEGKYDFKQLDQTTARFTDAPAFTRTPTYQQPPIRPNLPSAPSQMRRFEPKQKPMTISETQRPTNSLLR